MKLQSIIFVSKNKEDLITKIQVQFLLLFIYIHKKLYIHTVHKNGKKEKEDKSIEQKVQDWFALVCPHAFKNIVKKW